MRVVAPAIVIASLLTFAETGLAQDASSLVGTWERFAHTSSKGRSDQRPLPTALLIFTREGYYSQTAIPPGRSKTNRPLSQLTLKEMLQRFDGAEARYGRFSISGDTLTRTAIASLEPANEAASQVQLFRLAGDTLILSSSSGSDRTEARFRRVRQ